MLHEKGKVVAVEADRLWVEVVRQTACNGCAAKSSCGKGVIENWFSRPVLIPVEIDEEDSADVYAVNDHITVAVDEGALVTAAFASYLVPAVALILGGIVGGWLFSLWLHPFIDPYYEDLVSFIGSGLGLLMIFLISRIKRASKSLALRLPFSLMDSYEFKPTIVKP